MRLSSMADYAVVTMAAAARHCGAGAICAAATSAGATKRPLNTGQLAEETGVPVPTVQKLVSRLVAAGLLKTTRGAGGGLKLARPAAAISLAEIIEAVEGPIALTPCVHVKGAEQGKHDCSLEQACAVRPHWAVVNETIRGALADVPLSRLIGAARQAEVVQ